MVSGITKTYLILELDKYVCCSNLSKYLNQGLPCLKKDFAHITGGYFADDLHIFFANGVKYMKSRRHEIKADWLKSRFTINPFCTRQKVDWSEFYQTAAYVSIQCNLLKGDTLGANIFVLFKQVSALDRLGL